MEIFNQLVNQFSQISHIKEWNELQSLFQKVAKSKPKHWLLPLYACEAVGGNINQAMPAILAVGCSHISIVLVDDMLDEDERGEYVKLGKPAVANMASALQSVAVHVITESGLNQNAKLQAIETVNEMFFATTIGQYWDVNSIVKDEDDYWKITKAKSSPFFGASFQLGALIGGASFEKSLQIKELGSMYGEMIQIHDDVDDALSQPAKPDWESNNKCLPILFASMVDHPQKNRFNKMRPNARTNLKSLEEAQEILIQCGAISYCMYQLLERYEIVKEKISKINLQKKESLQKVFDDVVQPVYQLFNEIDSPRTAAIAS
ncbi:MAG: polyprenyl synthetase family protein [Anaerolineales bacterium]|nr:polyprenyl synthetase family protein [Anaerolineales bacterium]